MAKKQSSPLFSKIIVPVDFSSASERAFLYAARLASMHSAKVIAAFVKDADDLAIALRQNMQVRHDEVPHLESKVIAMLESKFQALSQKAQMHESISFLILKGNAAEQILKLARKEKADLIVTGTRGRSRMSSFILGSTARELIVHSTCPVLTVNERKK